MKRSFAFPTALILVFSLNVDVGAQTQAQRDSAANEMCKVLKEMEHYPDTVRLLVAYQKARDPFLKRYPADAREEIWAGMHFRLQRNCPVYKEILDRVFPQSGGWQRVAKKPETTLDTRACRKFFAHRKHWYLETNGDTVQVDFSNNQWVDHFKDGTYSRLKRYWVSDCEFELEFVESNNEMRSRFSVPGDKYRYQILEKKDGYYEMSVQAVGVDQISLFHFYYER